MPVMACDQHGYLLPESASGASGRQQSQLVLQAYRLAAVEHLGNGGDVRWPAFPVTGFFPGWHPLWPVPLWQSPRQRVDRRPDTPIVHVACIADSHPVDTWAGLHRLAAFDGQYLGEHLVVVGLAAWRVEASQLATSKRAYCFPLCTCRCSVSTSTTLGAGAPFPLELGLAPPLAQPFHIVDGASTHRPAAPAMARHSPCRP